VRSKSLLAALVAILCLCTMASPVSAQGRRGDTIQRIVVEGTSRIDPETIGSYLQLKPGDPFDPAKMDASLKALFATGLFRDVTLRREGQNLVVRVVENPIINRIAFEGNSKLKDTELSAEIPLRARSVFSRPQVEASVRRILELYRATGRFGATVTPKIIELPQNRVNLVFEINEGDTTKIQRIRFVGNREFSDGDLRGEIDLKESAWWRLLGSADVYDPDKLNADREKLRKFYLSRGFADMQVTSAVAELTPDKKGFFVTYTIVEGERYRFGKVDINAQIKGLEPAALRGALRIKSGDRFNGDRLEDSAQALTNMVGSLGYAFAQIRPVTTINRQAKTVDVVFEIREGAKVFVERIEIRGNTRTRDEVIRREFRIAEGDAFNTSLLQQARRRLINLGFFEKIEIVPREGSAPDRVVIGITVSEKATGEFSIGAGYSTDEGALGSIGLKESNFMGRGQELTLSFFLSQRSTGLDLSFTEPYFLNRNMAAGFDAFRKSRDFQREGGFDQRELGFRLRFGYRITEDISQRWAYELSNKEIRGISSNTSALIQAEQGTTTTSSISTTLTWDTRDNRFVPTEGFILQGTFQYAGLGASEHFVKGVGRGGYWYAVAPNYVISIQAEAGVVQGIGGNRVKLAERFFVGGDTFRGFRVGGVGPRDSTTGDGLGANMYYVVTGEISFPIGLPREFGILGRAFVDVGSAWDVDITDPRVQDINKPRIAVGVGISWASPFGPLRVDLGFPLIKQTGDKTQLVHFRFGTRF
jgi:outer membrane protein insertion porin family